jgi:L-fuculose-phosphate aldolase
MRVPSAAVLGAARRRVHQACLNLVADRLVVGSAGNISERIGEHWMVVSPGGRLYAELKADQYPLVHLESATVHSGLAPTSEMELHLSLYKLLPDTKAVVHTHSRYAAAFAVARVDLPFVCNENIGPVSEHILVTDTYAAPGTADLGQQAVATFNRQPGSRAVLLANHGVVAIGETVAKAYTVAQQVEWIAEVTHHAATLKPALKPALAGVVVIPSDQQDLIGRNYGFSVSRQLPSRGGASRTRSQSAKPKSR